MTREEAILILVMTKLTAVSGRQYDEAVDMAIGALSEERTGEWVHEVDTGTAMLKCPECECRVIEKWYRLAVGTKANKCPYCGAKMGGDTE